MSTEYSKKYYETHKEKWLGHKKCDICGGNYIMSNKKRHIDSKKHQLALVQKEVEDLKNKINTIRENLK